MRIAIESFRGEVPRLTPRALPDNAAQAAVNARMLSGDLEAWRQLLQVKTLTAAAAIKTIYLLKDKWLSWTDQVDVARGVIPGDDTYRLYLTCPALYGRPQFTNYAMATTGAEPFPVATRPLGVPPPDAPPTVAVSVSASEESNIVLTNPGAESGTTAGWTVSVGSLVAYLNGDVAGLSAQAGSHFFGGGAAASSTAHEDINLGTAGVLAGQGLKLAWYQASGAAGSKASMGIEFYDSGSALISSASLDQVAVSPADTWERREMTVQMPDGAVTARLIQNYTLVGAGPTIDAYIDDITFNSVAYTNFFDGSSLTGWDVSPNHGAPGDQTWHQVSIDATVGWAAPSWLLRGDTEIPWIRRNFSTDGSPAVTLKFDFMSPGSARGSGMVFPFGNDAGNGTGIGIDWANGLFVRSCSSWDDPGITVQTLAAASFAADKVYTATLSTSQVSSSTAKVTITIVDSNGTVVVAPVSAQIPIDGPNIGFKGWTGNLESDFHVDNVYVTVSPPKSLSSTVSTATAYVYRFLNDLGEPSAPSLPSETIVRPDGGSATVTMPTAIPSGIDPAYGITTKQIYRAVTGATGSVYVYVDQVPLAQATYSDVFDDAAIAGNEVLNSQDWDLPPDDLEGIIALPNGIMAGFRRNQLCFSAQDYPHAWPVGNRINTDTDIVAIANVDTTVMVGTKSFFYTASGTTPESYTMSKPGAAQACVSKQSMGNLLAASMYGGVLGGVVFASPNGLMIATSATQVHNLTASLFTRNQWQALRPENIRGVVHDDIYFLFFDPAYAPNDAPAGYAIDSKPDGFGVMALGFHAQAVYADPLTDNLYLVPDFVDEPWAMYLPIASSAPNPDGKTIFQFDGDDANRMVYRYRGKLNLLPYPAAFVLCQVQAEDYSDLVLRIFADGALMLEQTITSVEPFTLPMLDDYRTVELELVGTSTVRRVQQVHDAEELT